VAVNGPDRAGFLNGFLTNDTASLTAGEGCYAAWLTPQGRMLCDLHVLESGDMMLLDVPAREARAIADRFEQFHFSEDVQIAVVPTLRSVWLHGPAAARILESLTGTSLEGWKQYQNARVECAGIAAVVARIDQLAVPGYVLYVDARSEADVTAKLHAAGAIAATPATIETARVEAAYPVFGVDMSTDTIPLEAGIEDRAISLTKGCYVGQEVIIRVLHRGGGRVVRRLVRLQVDGDVPEAHSKIFAGDREIGFVTSSARSPRLGVIALGYVHRDFVEPGAAVDVEVNGARAHASVSSPTAS
jgi:folate-binding protein YgfZ